MEEQDDAVACLPACACHVVMPFDRSDHISNSRGNILAT
jgi:hypothetical protein